jgi:hypothetical protein
MSSASPPTPPLTPAPHPVPWKVGERVLAAWPPDPNGWYPGTVRDVAGDDIAIDYDDGDKATVRPDQVAPLNISLGCRVQCRWKGIAFFPGTVDRVDGEKLHVQYDDGDTEWTTVRYMRVERGGRVRIKEDNVPVFSATDRSSPALGELQYGQEVVLGQAWRVAGLDWVEVTLPDGRRGHVAGTTQTFPVRKVVLLDAEAGVHGTPADTAPVVAPLRQGEELWLLDLIEHEGRNWFHVKDAAGTEGFLDGEVRFRELHQVEPGLLGSAIGGACVVLTIGGGLGGIALLIRGRFLEALALFVVCVVSGAAAGVAHYLLAPLRRSEYGLHLSWVLVMQTYLFAAIGCVVLAGQVSEGLRAEGVLELLTQPIPAGILAGVGLVIGMGVGYAGQLEQRRAQHRPMTFSAWALPAVGAAGGALLIAGATFLSLGLEDWQLAHESAEPAQELTLAELLDKGFGKNRYVRLTGFRFCNAKVTERTSKGKTFTTRYNWAPLVPSEGKVKAGEPAPPVPPQVRVVVRDVEMSYTDPLKNAARLLGGRRPGAVARPEMYTGMVVTGLRPLPAEVQEKLRALAPQTDLARLLVLDNSLKPVERDHVALCVDGGTAALVGGAVLVLVALLWARRAGRRAGSPAAAPAF